MHPPVRLDRQRAHQYACRPRHQCDRPEHEDQDDDLPNALRLCILVPILYLACSLGNSFAFPCGLGARFLRYFSTFLPFLLALGALLLLYNEHTITNLVRNKIPRRSSLIITVIGAGPHSVTMRIKITDTVEDLLLALRRQHRIASLRKIRQSILFPPVSRQPLDNAANLVDVGVRDLSILYLRHFVLGGASQHEADTNDGLDEAAGPSTRHAKRRRRDREDMRTDVWKFDSASLLYTCLVCPGFRKHDERHISSHEASTAHKRCLKAHDQAIIQSPENTAGPSKIPLSETPGNTFNISDDGKLGRLGRVMRQMDLQDFSESPVFPSRTGSREQSPAFLDWDDPQLHNTGPQISDGTTDLDEERLYGLVYNKIGVDNVLPGSSDGSADGELDDFDSEGEGPSLAREAVLDEMAGPSQPEDSSSANKSKWFPWPSRLTYIYDVLRNVPRCAFSRKQIGAVRWAMSAAGLAETPPSDSKMDSVDRDLQEKCGIRSLRYEGKLGHVYYVNDLAGIVAQEMANPNVRPHLHFLPEDSSPKISEAWQAERWLHEQDPRLATQMERVGQQDYYVFEPALLRGTRDDTPAEALVYMPTRWFVRGSSVYARAWQLYATTSSDNQRGWIVDTRRVIDIESSQLLLSFPELVKGHLAHSVPDPRVIFGRCDEDSIVRPWDPSFSDPKIGNPWRQKAQGHRCVSLPVWLYCDDTSGNVSKRWNKHNSFLFTAAGLPRCQVHKESSIHFLSTSNIAPPLEMLDGIVEQLEKAQEMGIWAWDWAHRQLVLVIVSVLAMLGDNPMQSEFSCHIGFMGRLFCRVCWASRGAAHEETEGADVDDGEVGEAAAASGRGKKRETLHEMIQRLNAFISKSRPRTRDETMSILRSQFETALILGGKADYERQRTVKGIKDVFMEHFVERLFYVNRKGGGSKAFKEKEIARLRAALPANPYSPVWRIRDFDPHSDTPVEILHVILLGFVKYFWRDTLARLNKSQLETLKTRISSFDVRGLGVSPLSGERLVTYGRSLTGSDFRVIAQIAPFVLQGLMKQDNINVWCALSLIVTSVWQPEIEDMSVYLPDLDAAITNFMDRVCVLTPQWFNKPKFHVLLHLPDHIQRFGPAMLFATEGFESFNAVIREASVHSNRHAPSRDIAAQMARRNRVRHLLSGGLFLLQPSKSNARAKKTPTRNESSAGGERETLSISPWSELSPEDLDRSRWRSASTDPRQLLENGAFGMRVLDLPDPPHDEAMQAGACSQVSAIALPWRRTLLGCAGVASPSHTLSTDLFRSCETVVLSDGSTVKGGDWVLFCTSADGKKPQKVGRIEEILLVSPASSGRSQVQSLLCIQQAIFGDVHESYHMRRIEPLNLQFAAVIPANWTCMHVNVQHNCLNNPCTVTKSRIQRQEGEVAAERGDEITHRGNMSDFLLNSAQMRNAAAIRPFQPRLQTLNRSDVIRDAAITELQKGKGTGIPE